jgi:hypothetical protein
MDSIEEEAIPKLGIGGTRPNTLKGRDAAIYQYDVFVGYIR